VQKSCEIKGNKKTVKKAILITLIMYGCLSIWQIKTEVIAYHKGLKLGMTGKIKGYFRELKSK